MLLPRKILPYTAASAVVALELSISTRTAGIQYSSEKHVIGSATHKLLEDQGSLAVNEKGSTDFECPTWSGTFIISKQLVPFVCLKSQGLLFHPVRAFVKWELQVKTSIPARPEDPEFSRV
jgi:hypothetical protein